MYICVHLYVYMCTCICIYIHAPGFVTLSQTVLALLLLWAIATCRAESRDNGIFSILSDYV